MTANIDEYMNKFDFGKGKHVFFFPPYSSLFWNDAKDEGYFDSYLEAKRYFFEAATARGAIVYDFQGADFTVDLEEYKDNTHYRPEINDWMVKCFANGDYLVTTDNYGIFQEKLIENTKNFRKEYADLFN